MTGYAKKDFKIQDCSFSLAIKSLNSTKGLDISIKAPRYFTSLEPEIRALIEQVLIRGKVQFIITENNMSHQLLVNKKALTNHIKTIKTIIPEADNGSILSTVFKLPDVFSYKMGVISHAPGLKKCILSVTQDVLKNVKKYRKKEGRILIKEVRMYINNIIKIANEIKGFEKQRLINKKNKILDSIKKNVSHIEYDLARLETEMIYYFEKQDITEERVRLQHHCKFFLEVVGESDPIGKKLTFLSQEILREVNTIGSKANDFEIQKRVVLMKEEIDKTKEQLCNIL